MIVIQLHIVGLYCRTSNKKPRQNVREHIETKHDYNGVGQTTEGAPKRILKEQTCKKSQEGDQGQSVRKSCKTSTSKDLRRLQRERIRQNMEHYKEYKVRSIQEKVVPKTFLDQMSQIDNTISSTSSTTRMSHQTTASSSDETSDPSEGVTYKKHLSRVHVNPSLHNSDLYIMTSNGWRDGAGRNDGGSEIGMPSRKKENEKTIQRRKLLDQNDESIQQNRRGSKYGKRRLNHIRIEDEFDNHDGLHSFNYPGMDIGQTSGFKACPNQILENMFIVTWKALKETEAPYVLPVWKEGMTGEEILFDIQNDAVIRRAVSWKDKWVFGVAIGINIISSVVVSVGAAIALHHMLEEEFFKGMLTGEPLKRIASHRLDNEVTSTDFQ